jgi:hypothetical protein
VRETERHAWRETALALIAGARIDCQVHGSAGSACPAAAPLRSAALGALEMAARPLGGDGIDGLAARLSEAASSGSIGAQGPWVGAFVGDAETDRQSRWACETEPLWRDGHGLTEVSVPGTAFRISVPQGTRTQPGAVVPREGLPITFGVTSRSVEEILASLPRSCTVRETDRADARVLDCAGADLLSSSRLLHYVLDLGDTRALAVLRVRHTAPDGVVAPWMALLRTLTRRPGVPTLSTAELGIPGDASEWPVLVTVAEGGVHLSDSVSPRRSGQSAWVSSGEDAAVCAQARAARTDATRIVIEDTTLDGGGCHHAAYVAEAEGAYVLTLHVEPHDGQFLVVQHFESVADEASARARVDTTRAAIARLIGGRA